MMKMFKNYIPRRKGFLHIDKYLSLNLILCGMLTFLFFSKFSFGYGLLYGCIPADLYMIDKYDKTYEVGDMIAFRMPKEARFIHPEDKVIKIVAGKGGDHLKVTMDGVYNGKKFFKVNARRISIKYGIPPGKIEREIDVPINEIFVVGQTDHSWDSRFWGTVIDTTTIGKAYAIF
ncbi:UNVERIFIED_ORG: conjugal transfer pilin signal peptidase TrbI [Rahnella aquatilis]